VNVDLDTTYLSSGSQDALAQNLHYCVDSKQNEVCIFEVESVSIQFLTNHNIG
jgi:hypothetical protein